MRTPKSYTDNLNNGLLTRAMLSDALYSVNKRAKNCRDKEQQWRYSYYDKYGSAGKYCDQKEKYYTQKEIMLSVLAPTCIHIETYNTKCRFYDYEPEYQKHFNHDRIFNEGSYYDKELDGVVNFIDVFIPAKRYYLFYDLGERSFHTPLYNEFEIEKYPNLEKIEIDQLITFGHEITDLVSTTFVKKVVELIKSKHYTLIN